MAKKNVEDAQQKAVAEAGSQEENQKGQEQQAPKAKVTTTEGNTIDKTVYSRRTAIRWFRPTMAS